MNAKRLIAVLIPLTAAIFATSGFGSDEQWPEVTEDGLHRVHDTKMAVVYIEPGADLSGYNRIHLMEPTVAFKKNWERDLRARSVSRLSTSSRVNTKKIKQDLVDEFNVIFTEKLRSGGFELVEESADDVLLVRPSIVDLDITAPEVTAGGRSTSQIRSHGEMTLFIELFDSVTGDEIAKAVDRRVDRENERMFSWATKHTNQAAAQRILDAWAQILVDALTETKGQSLPLEN